MSLIGVTSSKITILSTNGKEDKISTLSFCPTIGLFLPLFFYRFVTIQTQY